MSARHGARDVPFSAAAPPAIEQQLPGELERNHKPLPSPKPAQRETRDPAPALPRERLACLARRIHRLGERPLYELFRELASGAPLLPRLERYARLEADYGDFIRALSGDRLTPLRSIPGGRDDNA
jgi:hypothetical protein